MPPVRSVKSAVVQPQPSRPQGGKLELRFPRIPADARTWFVVSLLAYACWDLALHPLLHWLLGCLAPGLFSP